MMHSLRASEWHRTKLWGQFLTLTQTVPRHARPGTLQNTTVYANRFIPLVSISWWFEPGGKYLAVNYSLLRGREMSPMSPCLAVRSHRQ